MSSRVIADQYYQTAFENPVTISMHDSRSFFTPENLKAWQAKASRPEYDFSNLSVEDMYFAVASGYLSDSNKSPKILEAARKLIENSRNDLDLSIPKPILGALGHDFKESLEKKLDAAKGRMLRYNRAIAVLLSSPDPSFRDLVTRMYQDQLKIDGLKNQ